MIPGVRIHLTGIDEAIARTRSLQDRLWMIYVAEALDRFGADVTRRMKEHHPPGGPHPEAGEMPVYGEHAYIDRTGQLTRSIGYTVEVYRTRAVVLNIFATAPYAVSVEHGIPGRARPYPFFWPSLHEFLPSLEMRLQTAVLQAFDDHSDRSVHRMPVSRLSRSR